VLVRCAGATATPNYQKSAPANAGGVPVQPPEAVAREALDALGRMPLVITGTANKLASFLLRRVLPRKLAVRIMGQNTRKMYGK
jgi:short-subunit dehydrogenase